MNPRAMEPSKRSHIPAFEVMRITDEIARRRADGHDVVSLCAGEPSARPAPGTLKPAGYTGPLGTTPLREAIAGHYRAWYGVEVDPGRVAVTTGSSGAFQLVFLTVFDPGDRVALASPGYPAYRNILAALGVQVVEIPTDATTRYQPTPALLDAAAAEHGELAGLIVASPANPTGTMLGRAELAALVDWCRIHGTRLISDEIYHGITYGAPAVSMLAEDRQAIVVNSFSKYFSMAGWRLGWVVVPAALVDQARARMGNLFLTPPVLAQHAGLIAFDCRDELEGHVATYARNRDLLLAALPGMGLGRIAPPDGAFYIYADIGHLTDDSMAFCIRLLEETGVATAPGIDFDPVEGHRFIRISFAVSTDRVIDAIERMRPWFAARMAEARAVSA